LTSRLNYLFPFTDLGKIRHITMSMWFVGCHAVVDTQSMFTRYILCRPVYHVTLQ